MYFIQVVRLACTWYCMFSICLTTPNSNDISNAKLEFLLKNRIWSLMLKVYTKGIV